MPREAAPAEGSKPEPPARPQAPHPAPLPEPPKAGGSDPRPIPAAAPSLRGPGQPQVAAQPPRGAGGAGTGATQGWAVPASAPQGPPRSGCQGAPGP